MPLSRTKVVPQLCIAAALLLACAQTSAAQQTQEQQPSQSDDVVRVTTELVQTDVMVFDKQGRFVDGLKPEQFTLKVDGKAQPISFFERVTAGGAREESQIAASRGRAAAAGAKPVPGVNRGRTVIFFLDDMHMAADSLERARKTITRFIDDEMGPGDIVAATSPSGQIGFLQQFTDNKAVLRAALARLRFKSYESKDMERPPITVYQALAIERNDHDVVEFFIDELLRQNPMLTRPVAEDMIRTRARQKLQEAAAVTTNMLDPLEGLMRTAARAPGRKIVFFFSDGFFLDERNSDSIQRLHKITDAAARAGVIFYAVDARGLITGMPDASQEVVFDMTGRLARATAGEHLAQQDPLFTLAAETGGRAFINTNDPVPKIKEALEESSAYYLLAWRPDSATQRGGKYRRLEVSIVGRPDLTVRARRGFFSEPPKATADKGGSKKGKPAPPPKTPDEEMRAAIGDVLPSRGVPTSLVLNYMDTPEKGMTVLLGIQVSAGALQFEEVEGKQSASLDLLGLVLNDQGKQVSAFKNRLDVTGNFTDMVLLSRKSINYNHQAPLPAGIYQARVAARDRRGGRIGTAIQWIEVPDLSKRQFTLSSLFLGERTAEQGDAKTEDALPQQVELNVRQHFSRTSRLRFLTYIYNAAAGADGGAPDVALQIQVLSNNLPVVTAPLKKVSTEGINDLARIPFAAEIPLDTISPGRYVLQITAIDRTAKASASQRVNFEIE